MSGMIENEMAEAMVRSTLCVHTAGGGRGHKESEQGASRQKERNVTRLLAFDYYIMESALSKSDKLLLTTSSPTHIC